MTATKSLKERVVYKCYPFFYSITNGQSAANPDPVDYITCPAGSQIVQPISLQQDKNHLILYYKFIAWAEDIANPGCWIPTDSFRNPLYYLDYLKIQALISSRGSTAVQDLQFAGLNQTQVSGMGMVRKPYLLPKASSLSITYVNTYTAPLRIAGFVYCYKSTV